MEVSNRKPADPEIKLENLEQEADFYRKSIHRIESIEDEMKGELWKEIKDRLGSLIKSIDDQEYQYAKGKKTVVSLDCLLGQKAAAIDVLSIEEFVKSKKDFEDRLDRVKEKIGNLAKSAGGNGRR